MDSFDKENEESQSGEEGLQTDEDFGHTDKVIGLFTSPTATFERIAKFPPKVVDWVIPLIILTLVVVISNLVMMNNQEIAYQVKQKQIEAAEKGINQAVTEGKMTKEQADAQMTRLEDYFNSPLAKILSTVGIIVVLPIIFFIVTGVYLLLVKFGLKGDGTYGSALVANGMTLYIGMISVILAAILAFVFGRILSDVSIASLMNSDKSVISGYLLSKLDIITIWGMVVFSIALAKMFKSATTGKYYGLVFGVWIFWSLFSFWLGKAVPFLNFNR
jgi:hypothetical protein